MDVWLLDRKGNAMKTVKKTPCNGTGTMPFDMDDSVPLKCVNGMMYTTGYKWAGKKESVWEKCRKCKGTGLMDEIIEIPFE